MAKNTKIHVMRHKLELDIEVDPASHASLDHAVHVLTSICAYVAGLDHPSLKVTDSRLARVDAPKPAPAPAPKPAPTPEPKVEAVEPGSEPNPAAVQPAEDGMDFPENLDRRAETA